MFKEEYKEREPGENSNFLRIDYKESKVEVNGLP